MTSFHHQMHPRVLSRRNEKPPQTTDERVGFNGRLGLVITKAVGTMWMAYIFAGITLISLPEAIRGGTATTVSWIAQTFLQLVLLSIIMVGQNVQSKAADKRAIQTYEDAEAILHESLQIQAHMIHQDQVIQETLTKVEELARTLGLLAKSAETKPGESLPDA